MSASLERLNAPGNKVLGDFIPSQPSFSQVADDIHDGFKGRGQWRFRGPALLTIWLVLGYNKDRAEFF